MEFYSVELLLLILWLGFDPQYHEDVYKRKLQIYQAWLDRHSREQSV
jgi:hypothetical protein